MSGALVTSFKVQTTLTAYRVVAPVTGTANTVKYPATTGCHPMGITIDDVKDTTTAIPVQVNGIAKLYFNDTCTSGKLVAFDTSGRGTAYSYATTSTAFTLNAGTIGLLVGATVAATGTIADVAIFPALMR